MSQQPAAGVAIITGAAGGMGAACAALLCDSGQTLLLCDLKEGPLAETASALRSRGTEVETLAGDISDSAFADRLVGALGGREVATLIHTAGLSPTMGDADRIFAVNYDATVRIVDAVRPKMAAGGCAVLISSCSAYMIAAPEIDAALNALKSGEDSASLRKFAEVPEAAYPISKRAVTRLVAREAPAFGERQARIVSLSPGLIDTSMGRAEQAASPMMAVMRDRTPLGRFGQAEEIASVAVFLCSPGAAFISGCDILVDGGMLAALGKLPGQG